MRRVIGSNRECEGVRGSERSEGSEREGEEQEGASHLVKLSLPDIFITDSSSMLNSDTFDEKWIFFELGLISRIHLHF